MHNLHRENLRVHNKTMRAIVGRLIKTSDRLALNMSIENLKAVPMRIGVAVARVQTGVASISYRTYTS